MATLRVGTKPPPLHAAADWNCHTEGNSVLKSQDKQRSLRSPH